MRYLKAFFLAALVLAAFGVTTATAGAETSLPSLLFLTGTTEGSLKATSTTAKTEFTGIQNLKGTGYLFVLSGKDMDELGLAKLLFTNVTLSTKKCNTEGDGSGLVLIDDAEWHLALGLSGETLLLILLTLTTHIECEGILINVTGSQESKVTKGFGAETTTLEGETGACTGSTPAFSEYDNMSGTMSKVELKSETGGIKAKSCEEVEGKIVFTASSDVEIMEP